MQVKKREIRQRILDAAREHFLKYGFQDSSLRKIAAEAGISVSNMYNYFRNKDELFRNVVSPVADAIQAAFDRAYEGRDFDDRRNWSYEAHVRMVESIAAFIDKNRAILKILAFKSYGSSYDDYKEELVEAYSELSIAYMKAANEAVPDLKMEISNFCVHNLSSFRFNLVSEILMHDIPYEKIIIYLKEALTFMFYGYEGLFEYDFNALKPRRFVK